MMWVLDMIPQSLSTAEGSELCSSPRVLPLQLQFSEVLVKWRRFFHQMAVEQGQGGRTALEMKLEVEKLQVSGLISKGCAAGGGPGGPRSNPDL